MSETKLSRVAWAVLAVTCLVWVGARVLPVWNYVYQDQELRLMGADPYYHLRQTKFTLDSFPTLHRWDAGTMYPAGYRNENAGAFHLLTATAAALVGGSSNPARLKTVVAWSPILLGLALLLALYGLAREFLEPSWACLAPLLLTLAPGQLYTYTLLGFADHHVLEVLLVILTAWGGVRVVKGGPPWLWALPLAVFQYAWPGAPIHLVWVAVGLSVTLMMSGRDEQKRVAAFGLCLFLYLLPVPFFPDLIGLPQARPLMLLGSFAIALVVPLIGWASEAIRTGKRKGPGFLIFVTVGLALIVLIKSPQGQALIAQLFEQRSTLIGEHRLVSLADLWQRYGLAFPTAFLGLLLTLRRGTSDPTLFLPIVAGLSLFGLWAVTLDFGYLPPAWLAFFGTFTLAELFRWVGRPKISSLVLGLWLFLVAAGPWLWNGSRLYRSQEDLYYSFMMRDGVAEALDWLRLETPEPEWKPNHPLGPWGVDLSYPEGAYGVYCPWDYGHLLAERGDRLSLFAGFPHSRDARILLARSEQDALTEIFSGCQDQERVRYALFDTLTIGEYFPTKVTLAGLDPGDFRAEAQTLIDQTGQPQSLTTFGAAYNHCFAVRAMAHDGAGYGRMRLVFESQDQTFLTYTAISTGGPGFKILRRSLPVETAADRLFFETVAGLGGLVESRWGFLYNGQMMSSVKIFEIVEGALLTGQTVPRATVQVELDLQSHTTGRTFVATYVTQAEEDGLFSLRVPYPTGPGSPTEVTALSLYRVLTPDRTYLVEVDESQVRTGASLPLKAP